MHELKPEELKSYCDPRQFKFKSTEEVYPLEGTVGQHRAVRAIEFGFEIKTPGFNVFVVGPTGTGRSSTVKAYVKKIAEKESPPSDWCYVYNFSQPDVPLAVEFPSGKARVFAQDIEALVNEVKAEIPKIFESEQYQRRRDEINESFQRKREQKIAEVRDVAKKRGFDAQITAAGVFTVPLIEGRPLKREEYEKLEEKEKQRIQEESRKLQEDINHIAREIRELEKEAKEKIQELDRETALFIVGHLLEEVKEKYKDHPKVVKYLDEMRDDIIDNLEAFKGKGEEQIFPFPGFEGEKPIFDRYKVNVFVDNSSTQGAPVVFENNPSYPNLFGRIEYEARLGAMVTDFTMIKPGSLHKANGGYLIVRALELLTNFMSWEALKRTLRNREIQIENIGEQFRVIPTVTLRPEPIPINLKVIMIGAPLIYHLLYLLDEDFRKLFKIRADFSVEMDRTPDHIEKYASFIASKCKEEDLRHFDPTAVAKVVEYGSRLVENKKKLSTRFIEISDLISEASFWAEHDRSKYVRAEHVERAIREKIYRSNQVEEKIQELIEDGTLLIDTDGEVVGQVNGISVYDLGDYSFGKPTRITARSYMGRPGVVSVEREAKLGGRIYSKAVMILSGYLSGKYAQDIPLSASISVGFEQLYEEIEGDSASSAEVYAILSELSGIPIKQGIAVTGSVNQRGEVQAIGGVNEKIEGFYKVCKAKGLTGKQGVIIPLANVKNLMLDEEVIEAVRDGRFHIYPVRSVDEGIEILTGIPAGKRRADGTYKKGTINYLVSQRLKEMAEKAKKFEAKKVTCYKGPEE